MTLTKKVIGGTVLFVFLLVVVLIVVIATFDLNRLKPAINQKVTAELRAVDASARSGRLA